MAGEPKINQQVEIQIAEKGMYQGIYKSRVEDVSEQFIVLASPIRQGEMIPIQAGISITVRWWDKGGGYVFTSPIRGRISSPIPLLYIDKPREVSRIQRRRFVRHEAKLPISYYLLGKETTLNNSETRDISGGGVSLETSLSVDKDDLLELEMILPTGERIQALGRIVRVTEGEKEGQKTFSLGIDFNAIAEKDRDKIVALIFQMQRNLRRKGLL